MIHCNQAQPNAPNVPIFGNAYKHNALHPMYPRSNANKHNSMHPMYPPACSSTGRPLSQMMDMVRRRQPSGRAAHATIASSRRPHAALAARANRRCAPAAA